MSSVAKLSERLATLQYLTRPSAGKRTGRNIGVHANVATDLEAVHVPIPVKMADYRRVAAPPRLIVDRFELRRWQPAQPDFAEPASVRTFYAAAEAFVCAAVGAARVHVFDHTLRTSGVSSLNAADGASAAGAVLRVHGDYTADSAPTRLAQLAAAGAITVEPAPSRFAFVNVWRSVDQQQPVLSHPLALCRPRSIDYARDTWSYHMHFEDRVGRNLAIEAKAGHEWGYYPRMTADEALLFFAFDSSAADGDVGVVHTAFDDPAIDGAGVPRRSVELRTVALWD